MMIGTQMFCGFTRRFRLVKQAFIKSGCKVSIFVWFLASDAMIAESIPPDKKQAIGTSLTRRLATA